MLTARKRDDQYLMRFPDGMRERIAARSRQNGRLMNTEIICAIEGHLANLNRLDDIERRLANLERKCNA